MYGLVLLAASVVSSAPCDGQCAVRPLHVRAAIVDVGCCIRQRVVERPVLRQVRANVACGLANARNRVACGLGNLHAAAHNAAARVRCRLACRPVLRRCCR